MNAAFKSSLLVLAIGMIGAAPSNANESAATQTFEQQRDTIKRLNQILSSADVSTKAQCEAAETANKKLFGTTDTSAATLKILANEAEIAQQACDKAEETRNAATLELRKGHDRLRQIVLGMPNDSVRTQTPDASALLKAGEEAQGRVNDIRAKADAAFGVTDATSRAALGQAGKDKEKGGISAPLAKAAIEQGRVVRQQARESQFAANRLVAEGLTIARCAKEGAVCDANDSAAAVRAKAALDRLNTAVSKAEDADKAMKAASYSIAADTLDDQLRSRYVRFRTLLDGNQDAKDLFGKDAYGLTAGKDGANVAFRWSFGGSGFSRRGLTTLVLATPASKDGDTRVADGLANASTLTVGRTLLRFSEGKKAGDWFYSELGISLRAGYQEKTFRLDDSVDEVVRRVHPWAIGAQFAFAPFTDDSASLHILSVERQRKFNDGAEETRCPIPANPMGQLVKCVNGVFGEPKRAHRWLASYSYRWKVGTFAATPKFSVASEGGKRTKEFEMPIYLVGASLEPKDGLAGGFSLGWVSGSGARFGLFIGGPLTSLYKRDWGGLPD